MDNHISRSSVDIVRRALDTEDIYNLLFIGPPASGKTLFLLDEIGENAVGSKPVYEEAYRDLELRMYYSRYLRLVY